MNNDKKKKFYILSTYGELLDVAIQLQDIEEHEVVMSVSDSTFKGIGVGIIKKDDNWFDYLGKDYIFVIDGCEHAAFQDWLRGQGEKVIGTNAAMSEYENDRQKGNSLFKDAGFKQPESQNFKSIEDAIKFIQENKDRRWVLKQNGDAPKSINHVGKFDDNSDMLFHLEELKNGWNETEYGNFDCDLMEFVEGVEVAASGFFNGSDWLRDKDGKIVGFLNFEEKKESHGGLGDTTGETGTTFLGVNEDNEIFKDILLRPAVTEILKSTGYRGVFDINGSLTDDGFVAFEPTCRFGIPASSYEFIEGLKTSTADLLEAMAAGLDTPVEIVTDWGMVIVVTSRPYPVEADLESTATSIGEKLWPLRNGKPVKDFSNEQLKHIHLENFERTPEGDYKVCTKSGYLLTVTGTGRSVSDVRDKISEYIRDNIYISGMKYRYDIGERIEEYL